MPINRDWDDEKQTLTYTGRGKAYRIINHVLECTETSTAGWLGSYRVMQQLHSEPRDHVTLLLIPGTT